MIARIDNCWFRTSTGSDNGNLIQDLIKYCDQFALRDTPKESKQFLAVYRLDDLLHTTLLKDGSLKIRKNDITIWGIKIEYAHMVERFLQSFNPKYRLTLGVINVSIISDKEEFNEIYSTGVNISEGNLPPLSPEPKSCSVVIRSPKSLMLSIRTKGTPLEKIDYIENSEKSSVFKQFADYKIIVDEVSLSEIQEYCRSVGKQLGEELMLFHQFNKSKLLDFLPEIDFAPSIALAEFNKRITNIGKVVLSVGNSKDDTEFRGARKLIPFIQKYYPTLTLYDALAGTHTILLDENKRIVLTPLVDIGFNFDSLEISSLDLSKHIPKLEYEEKMSLELLENIPLTKLILNGIYSENFPELKFNDLEELDLLNTLISKVDFNLKENLPNLKKLYIECQNSLESSINDWDINYIEKINP